MRKFLFLPLLFFSLPAFNQGNVVRDAIAKPLVTEAGKPAGEKTEMKIGKEGGSFTSSDGKIRLIVPADAVSKKVVFSIQPLTNALANGNGRSYRLEPSGTTFQKPLQLVFYYNREDEKGDMQLLMGIAMQNDKGEWYQLRKFSLDTLAKTITGSINHFSTWTVFDNLRLNPSSARVKVKNQLKFDINMIKGPPTDDADELAPLNVTTPSPSPSSSEGILTSTIWAVNDVTGGNSIVGQISDADITYSTYTAPAIVPDKNPVAVTAKLQGLDFTYHGVRFNDIRLVSNVTVYGDAYEVKMEATMRGGSPAAWGGITTYKDEGSFVVSLEKSRPAVIAIKNQFEVVTDNCEKVILNPTTCTGILHVAGVRALKVTPPNPPGQPYAIVEIMFAQYPTEVTRFKFLCPPPPGALPGYSKGQVDMASMPVLALFGMPALPTYIKFIAKDEEQVILKNGNPGDEIYYKFWVRKIND